MKKKITPVFLALVVGIIMGKVILNQYDSNINLVPAFNQGKKIYFVQYGVYSSEEVMKNSVGELEEYIYSIEDNKYYVYIAVSTKLENAEKIKEFYNKKKYNTNIREITINNKKFTSLLEKYDILLEEGDETIINTICKQVLEKYKEMIYDS